MPFSSPVMFTCDLQSSWAAGFCCCKLLLGLMLELQVIWSQMLFSSELPREVFIDLFFSLPLRLQSFENDLPTGVNVWVWFWLHAFIHEGRIWKQVLAQDKNEILFKKHISFKYVSHNCLKFHENSLVYFNSFIKVLVIQGNIFYIIAQIQGLGVERTGSQQFLVGSGSVSWYLIQQISNVSQLFAMIWNN